VTIREADAADLPHLVALMREHAAYERSAPPPADIADRLPSLLFTPEPRLHAIVAVRGADIIGYATCSREVSSWRAAEYLHLDCLYLRAQARGGGLGRRLMAEVERLARRLALTEIQWQTPEWNDGAIRFYDRLRASRTPKQRYTLTLAAGDRAAASAPLPEWSTR
jgi:GNAT superfamily N-acetyltransferase